ncbi:diguanylate cyclase [Kosakonia sp. H7A]|uniref:EAL domain-containing protein n=1 Tax=Kosakonia sp. H7A TaxID=2054598 RepID=UPI000D16BECB|nr:EAL domain-containing protein [Kosakonia sp. H7A]PTA93653.1 diguanylate cyclase [Kosakonia sp. H7A]
MSDTLLDYRLKFEPIVQLDNDALYGYEVLSHLPEIGNVDGWFRQQTPEKLLQCFRNQAQNLTFPKPQHRFFLNLPINVLLCTTLFMELLALCRPNLMIEIQDAQAFFRLGGAEQRRVQRNIARLEYTGTAIWLDDLNEESIIAFASAEWRVSGVKLDKNAFWQLSRTPERLRRILRHARQFANGILVEGIETAAQRDIARLAGAQFGQGFLWPARFASQE